MKHDLYHKDFYRHGIDYEDKHPIVVDEVTFQYFISLVIHEKLGMRLMDIVADYLYGLLVDNIYMKIHKGLKIPKACNSSSQEIFSQSNYINLYGFKAKWMHVVLFVEKRL